MAASEHTLTAHQTAGTTPAPRSQQTYAPPMPSVFRAIEYNLPPNYRRFQNDRYGYHWIYPVGKTNLSARIYPDVDNDTISVSVFDDSNNPNLNNGRSQIIKQWSGDVKLIGKWRRRLRRASGEALILANQRPACPRCGNPLIIRQRHNDQQQFFGCADFPKCGGSITITNHDVNIEDSDDYPLNGGRHCTLPYRFHLIEYNLPPNYQRLRNDVDGYHWIYRVDKTGLSARIYPDLDNARINISVYDDNKTPGLTPADSQVIKRWSGSLRLTNDWRRRLRRASKEASILQKKKKQPPKKKKPPPNPPKKKRKPKIFFILKTPETLKKKKNRSRRGQKKSGQLPPTNRAIRLASTNGSQLKGK